MATHGALPLSFLTPQRRLELQGSGRSGEGLTSMVNGMRPPLVLSSSQYSVTVPDWALLLTPESHLPGILKWNLGEHRVFLMERCAIPVGEAGGKPCHGSIHAPVNLSWVRAQAPCETLVRQRWTGHGLGPGGMKEPPGKEASGVFLWWLHSQSHHDAIHRDTGQAKWRHLMYKRHPPKYLPKKSLYPAISCLGSCCHTASVGAKEFRSFWGNQHLICLLLLAPLNSSPGRRHWEPKGFLPATWRGLSSYFLMHSSFLLPRFPHHPCRLWAHGEFSVFQQKCQVWFWHLWLSTSSKWMNARDTLLETRLVNAGGPAVSTDDFLWSFTQRHGGRMLRFPSAVPCCSEFGLLYGAQVGTFPLSYSKPYGHQAAK